MPAAAVDVLVFQPHLVAEVSVERGRDRLRDYGVLPSCVSASLDPSATACKAWCNIVGSALPRFSARRRIPRQAFAVKKYRCGTSPVSKISDNEHTTASLRDSEFEVACSHVLSVEHPICEPIPEFCQPCEEGSKIFSLVIGEDARNVFPHAPAGTITASEGEIGEHEVSTRVIKSTAKSRDTEALAGRSSDKQVNKSIRPLLEFGHVSAVRHVRVSVRQNCRRKGLDLRLVFPVDPRH